MAPVALMCLQANQEPLSACARILHLWVYAIYWPFRGPQQREHSSSPPRSGSWAAWQVSRCAATTRSNCSQLPVAYGSWKDAQRPARSALSLNASQHPGSRKAPCHPNAAAVLSSVPCNPQAGLTCWCVNWHVTVNDWSGHHAVRCSYHVSRVLNTFQHEQPLQGRHGGEVCLRWQVKLRRHLHTFVRQAPFGDL